MNNNDKYIFFDIKQLLIKKQLDKVIIIQNIFKYTSHIVAQ